MDGIRVFSSPTLRRSLLAAVLLGCTLLLAALLTVTPDSATLAGLSGPQCTLRSLLGEHACPGCGLTRATALAVQGRTVESLAVHPAGIPVALLCAAGLGVHLHVLWRRRRTARHEAVLRAGRWVFAIAVVVGWLAR